MKVLARNAVNADDGLSVSPLVNTDRKGGAFAIMLQQFKRALNVSLVRGMALHKLGRVHYVRRTAGEAWNAANANHAKGRWHPVESSYDRWFLEHVPEGYQAWEQFRNGHNYNVL